MNNKIQKINSVDDLRVILGTQYKKQIENYFADPQKALKFLSSVTSAVQRNDELLNCEPTSVINSFMTMAQLELMPSDVNGEAYVLPYKGKAQFQLGYQGLVTLFYRAGCRSIHADIVRKNDKFDYTNGVITHSPDVFADDRGEAIGAYVIIDTAQGGKITKVMNKKEILGIGQKFSKSFKSDYSPWNEKNDPELWMWKKTVMKQASKLVPKNETIFRAINEDNEDSNVSERMEEAQKESESLKMGNLIKSPEDPREEDTEDTNEQPQVDGDGYIHL